MKKILFVFFVTLLFVSCNRGPLFYSKDDHVDGFDIYKFEYENHKYLFIEKGYNQYATGGVVHDPNCSCFNK